MKRLIDIAASSLGLLLLSPLMLLIGLAIRIDSVGPVLFRQKRVGKNGAEFMIIKFRSMVTDAESLGPGFTSPGDRRVTRLGRILRKTSLDELPQLVNVLAGHMSLVGPRPDLPTQQENYSYQEWEMRHRVRPGVTGLAQARLRSDATPEQRKALDLEYVRRASVRLDLQIILETMKQLLTRQSY